MVQDNEKVQVGEQTIIEDAASYTSDGSSQNKGHTLQRGLKARHIQMIALGGTIGTGLFMASGKTIVNGGAGGALVGMATSCLLAQYRMKGH